MTDTTAKQQTHTVQVWPSGRGYEYRGDPDGPAEQKQLRAHSYMTDPPGPWREGQPDEWREILHEVRAEMYQDRDVLCCDSMLVDELIKLVGSLPHEDREFASAWSYDEIRNLYPNPEDWDADDCRAWLSEHVSEDTDGLDLDGLQDAVRDNNEPAEVFEWWRVSSWLCDELHEIGEVTIDNGYGHWWGRCCTGQQFIMDGVLQRVAARFDDL